MYLILRWLINSAALYVFANYYNGITLKSFYTALIVIIIFGLVNALIGGLLKLLTLPINIITLGLGCLFINGLMFWLTSTIVKGFEVQGFWAAFLGALVLSAVSVVTSKLLKK